MNLYQNLIKKQQEEMAKFPMIFAFNMEQLIEGMVKLGLKPEKDQTDLLYKTNFGGFYLKTDAQKLHDLLAKHVKEHEDEIKGENCEDFILDMFSYELSNHEYVVTGDLSDTLDALSLTIEEINDNPKLKEGLRKALELQNEIDY